MLFLSVGDALGWRGRPNSFHESLATISLLLPPRQLTASPPDIYSVIIYYQNGFDSSFNFTTEHL